MCIVHLCTDIQKTSSQKQYLSLFDTKSISNFTTVYRHTHTQSVLTNRNCKSANSHIFFGILNCILKQCKYFIHRHAYQKLCICGLDRLKTGNNTEILKMVGLVSRLHPTSTIRPEGKYRVCTSRHFPRYRYYHYQMYAMHIKNKHDAFMTSMSAFLSFKALFFV